MYREYLSNKPPKKANAKLTPEEKRAKRRADKERKAEKAAAWKQTFIKYGMDDESEWETNDPVGLLKKTRAERRAERHEETKEEMQERLFQQYLAEMTERGEDDDSDNTTDEEDATADVAGLFGEGSAYEEEAAVKKKAAIKEKDAEVMPDVWKLSIATDQIKTKAAKEEDDDSPPSLSALATMHDQAPRPIPLTEEEKKEKLKVVE